MVEPRRKFNPFYALVVAAGVAFGITACAYGLLAYRTMRGAADAIDVTSGFWKIIDEQGGMILAGEIILLGLATFLAIATDSFWNRRSS